MGSELLLPNVLESGMLLAFGAAWPVNILKSLHSRTAKGKSLPFLLIVMVGYICGIFAKLAGGTVNYVLFFYIMNIVMVGVDTLLYFRNLKLDKTREGTALCAAATLGDISELDIPNE